MAAKLTKDELLDLGLSEECAIRLAESEEQSKELGKELKLAMARIKELEEQAKARVAAEQEVRLHRHRERLREVLSNALASALWETRMYHRSVLTGRCGAGAGGW